VWGFLPKGHQANLGRRIDGSDDRIGLSRDWIGGLSSSISVRVLLRALELTDAALPKAAGSGIWQEI
jgi:hypothetical protein